MYDLANISGFKRHLSKISSLQSLGSGFLQRVLRPKKFIRSSIFFGCTSIISIREIPLGSPISECLNVFVFKACAMHNIYFALLFTIIHLVLAGLLYFFLFDSIFQTTRFGSYLTIHFRLLSSYQVCKVRLIQDSGRVQNVILLLSKKFFIVFNYLTSKYFFCKNFLNNCITTTTLHW